MVGGKTRHCRRWLRWCIFGVAELAGLACRIALAQDLAPRAYAIAPSRSNALTITYSFFNGNLDFQGAVPVKDATAKVIVPILTYYRSFEVFTRSANFMASLPYGRGTFRGTVLQTETNAYRSGFFDSVYRISFNVAGGPAMDLAEFRRWHQKQIVGISLRIVAPTGQYDAAKLINYGTNRWAFKPEVGYSRRYGHWVLDAYGGAWFYSRNRKFFSNNEYNPGIQSQTQAPVGALEAHLSYDVRTRFWASLDANFWSGGKTSLNGVENPDTTQRSSRLGITTSLPIGKHQSVKCSYSAGAYIRYGGNYQNLSVAWQYSWISRRY